MVEFVLDNTEIITAIATLILASTAAYSALQSKRSVDIIQKSRYDEFRPFLALPGEGARKGNGEYVEVEFILLNSGKGPLFDLVLIDENVNAQFKSSLEAGFKQRVVLKDVDEDQFPDKLTFQYQDIYSRSFQTKIEMKFNEGQLVGVTGNFEQIEVHG